MIRQLLPLAGPFVLSLAFLCHAAAESPSAAPPQLALAESGLPTPAPLATGVQFLEADSTLWAVDSEGRAAFLQNGTWQEAGTTLHPGASFAASEEGLIAVGGRDANGRVSPSVRLLQPGEKTRDLPALPVGVAGASVAVLNNTLFVIGGSAAEPGADDQTPVWTLSLDDPAAGWRVGEPLPGKPRTHAAVSAHHGTITVFGGRPVPADGDRLRETWSFRPTPVEGTSSRGWKRLADLPADFANPVAVPLGQVQILVADRAATGPLFGYNLVTDAWTPFVWERTVTPAGLGRRGSTLLVAATSSPTLFEARPETTLRRFGWIDYGVIALYFVALGIIGARFTRQESSEEFTLGNRKVQWWAAGLSMFATSASAISFMAVPALAFATNLVWFLPVLLLIPSYWATAYFVYPLLRRLNITSTFEYLEQRFNRPLRLLASGQCILLQTFGRGSIVLLLPSLAISLITGLDVLWSVAIMGVCTVIYTVSGGFEAVIWTEVFQAVLMFLAPVVIILTAISALPGGFAEFWQTGLHYSKFDLALVTWDITVPALWIMLLSGFVTTVIAPAGDQPVIQRVFSSPLSEVRKVNAVSNVCGIVIGLLTQGMGLALFVYFHRFPAQFVADSQVDQLVPLYVTQAMPVGFGGLIVAAIFAAAMSTVASATNSVATIYVEDFHPRKNRAANPAAEVRLLRLVSLLVGIIATTTALALGLLNLKSLMIVWVQVMALLGGGFVGVYILGMFTRRANGFGAVAGALGSVAVAFGLKLFTPVHWALYFPAAALSCIVLGYLFSLLRPAPQLSRGLTVYDPAQAGDTA